MSGQATQRTGGQATLRLREQERRLKDLERTPLFQALPRRHRRKVADLAHMVEFEDGQVVVGAGDPGDSFYLVLEGEALVTAPDGRQHSLPHGEHFGELSLIDGAPRAATVAAAGRLVAARIDRDDFLGLLHEEPGLAVGLLPGLVLVIRDLTRLDAERLPDHGKVGDWRETAGEQAAPGTRLEGRDALGWLLILRHVGVFEAVAERHLRHIARYVTVRTYKDGDNVVLAGSRGDAMYIVLGGMAVVRTPGGYLRMLGEDDCFGELALIDGAPRAATVSALGTLTAARISRTDFRKVLHAEPAMAVGLLDGLVATIRGLQMVDL